MSNIPNKKHSKDELAELRAKKAMQMAGQPIVNPYTHKTAKMPIIILGYLLALSAPLYLIVLKFQAKFNYELIDFKVMLFGTLAALVIAALIFATRSLSRHHASFMIIIALISSFSMVYLVNNDANLKREVLEMVGQETAPEKSEADRILEEALSKSEAAAAEKKPDADPAAPRRETETLTAEEKAEMKKMFAPIEERGAREIEAAKAKAEAEEKSDPK